MHDLHTCCFFTLQILAEFLRIHGSSQCEDLLKEGLAKHSSNLVHCYTTKKNNKDTAELLPKLKLASEEKDVDKEGKLQMVK